MITISRSIPRRILSARAPASDTDILEVSIRPFGTILIAAYFPVTACLAILTRPASSLSTNCPHHLTEAKGDLPELPFPIVLPILHCPIILASSLASPLFAGFDRCVRFSPRLALPDADSEALMLGRELCSCFNRTSTCYFLASRRRYRY